MRRTRYSQKAVVVMSVIVFTLFEPEKETHEGEVFVVTGCGACPVSNTPQVCSGRQVRDCVVGTLSKSINEANDRHIGRDLWIQESVDTIALER